MSDKKGLQKHKTILLGLIFVLNVICIILLIVLLQSSCDDVSIEPSTNGLEYKTPVLQERPSSTEKPAKAVEENSLKEPWELQYRIPLETIPRHYDVYLHPRIEEGNFTGRVNVWVEATTPRSFFVIHIKYLKVTSTRLVNRDSGVEVALGKTFEYKPNEFWVVKPRHQVSTGNYTLTLEFEGDLTKDIIGFYRASYTNQHGEKVYMVSSKFQPTYARRAFPCFDEPSFKSTFTTTLVRPNEKYIALSNMPQEFERPHPTERGLTEVRFQKSVPMVTYLAIFVVCDFSHLETRTSHGHPFRVFATPGQIKRARYALEIGANITSYLEDYFDVKYPLPKLDMIAIPDFVSGAMEHWGLITYRETSMLFDPINSSPANKARVATVVSHELVHMWFGNLVTLEWWNDLWLNEGFASYIEYKGVQQFHPDWDLDIQFLTGDLWVGLKLDAQLNSHPILQPVHHPDQITDLFDVISYRKGSSMLRMLENFMGAEDYRQGVHTFLKKYKYKNAVTADLWTEMAVASKKGLNISKIMDTWTLQMGYPLLSVIRRGDKYVVRQDRFLSDPSVTYDENESPYRYRWEVPVTWITNKSPQTHEVWLSQEDTSVTINVPVDISWIKFNPGHFGFYRVNYPTEDWKKLSRLLVTDHTTLSAGDRASLIEDAFALAEAEVIDYDIPLGMTAYLKKEDHYVPWKTAYGKLQDIARLTYTTETFKYMSSYILNLVSDVFEKLGWDDTYKDPQLDRLLRAIIVRLACEHGHQSCLDGAAQRLRRIVNDPEYVLSVNTRSLVYRFGISQLGMEVWDGIWHKYLNESNAQEKLKLLYGLAFTKEPWLLHRYIQYSKSQDLIRRQDFFTVITYISYNPVGEPITWDFVRGEWEYFVDRFTLHDRYLGRLIPRVSNSFVHKFQLDQMNDFFAKYPDAGSGVRSRKVALETIEHNINWLKNNRQSIHQWLVKNV